MNRVFRTIMLGLRSLRLHLFRSILTVMGILFGVAAVIVMMAVSEGVSEEAQEQIRALGSTNIILKSIKPQDNRQGSQGNQSSLRYGLLYADAELIQTTLPGIDVIVQARDYPKQLQYKTQIIEGVARGTVPWFPKVSNLNMLSGDFFSDLHEKRHGNVCVLTPQIARRLFLHEYPVGKMIKVGYEPFTVLGVIQEKTGIARDDKATETNRNLIYIPISSSRVYFGEQIVSRSSGSFNREDVELHEIQVRVDETDRVLPVANSVRRILAHNHPDRDYDVIVPLELLRTAEESERMFRIVLATIAGISLLVGGIGIMNIMLASVTERTREIGIRRALGAKKRHIVLQFLVETVVLSSLGGLAGVSLGLCGPILVTAVADIRTIVRPEFVALSFGISALVGIVFGLYPAQRAASLDPIEALRHE